MSQQRNSLTDHHSAPGPVDHSVTGSGGSSDIIPLAALARARATDQAGAAIAGQLNGPLTALMLYMGEIKQQSDKLAQTPAEREYLHMIVENALEQTERVCALVKQIAGSHMPLPAGPDASPGHVDWAAAGRPRVSDASAPLLRKPLTRREREVLKLIGEGHSNKQGALRMGISPRTFESHRAEAMRKLGARNTAELVRAALLNPLD
jgi:DNA-binding CsgD family transcriptional regulator